MARTERDQALLRSIGHNPDDPSLSVEWVEHGTAPVTNTDDLAEQRVRALMATVMAKVAADHDKEYASLGEGTAHIYRSVYDLWSFISLGADNDPITREIVTKIAADAIWLLLSLDHKA